MDRCRPRYSVVTHSVETGVLGTPVLVEFGHNVIGRDAELLNLMRDLEGLDRSFRVGIVFDGRQEDGPGSGSGTLGLMFTTKRNRGQSVESRAWLATLSNLRIHLEETFNLGLFFISGRSRPLRTKQTHQVSSRT